MRVINKTGATDVEFPPSSGNLYEAGEDGVFEFPEHVAKELTKKHAAHWVPESAQLGTQRRDRAAKLRNPRVAADTISRLEQRVETLEAQVAELTSFVVEPDDVDLTTEQDGEQDGGDASEDLGEGSPTQGQTEEPKKAPSRGSRGGRASAKKAAESAPE